MYFTDHLRHVKTLALTLMIAIVVVGIALSMILTMPGESLLAKPNPMVFLAQVAAGIAVHLISENFTYKPAPIAARTPRTATKTPALVAYQSGMILRFALSEAIAIVSIAAAFVATTGGFLTYVCGGLVALALMGYHVYPWHRPIDKTAEALDADGGQSYLRELFGQAPWTGTDADKPVVGATYQPDNATT